MQLFTRSRGRGTIRARVLAIALVPIVALMVVGVGLSAYLALQGINTRTFADTVRSSLAPTTRFIAAVQEERRLTTLEVTGMVAKAHRLDEQRVEVDAALRDMQAITTELAETAPDELRDPLQKITAASAEVPSFRQRVDEGDADAQEIYDFYSEMLEFVGAGIQGIARSATDAEVGFEQMISYDLFRSVEAQSRSHVLVVRGIAQGLDLDEFHELAHQMGSYHEVAETIYPRMTPQEQRRYDAMKDAPWWKTLVGGDNAVMARGPGQHAVDFNLKKWQQAAGTLSDNLLSLYSSHSTHAADLGTSNGTGVLTASLIAGLVVLLVAALALVIALAQSRRLIRRLTRLRQDTLDLADREMPEVVQRIGEGEHIDVDAEVSWLDHGDDEIGQVAIAFNKAQRQAIVATVREAETRSGVRAVFLNMAQRNQVMAHKQLQVLDKAERSQEDPEQLQLLFELDHLATQGRRNAESLIILGGKPPGRQWRKPVALRDVVNGAIAETAQYARVNVGKMADASLRGPAVGDMIHLLAELLDNATSFSPPQTDVDVRTAVVGKGVVVEIEDQGLGIEQDKLDELNAMLRTAPDFSVMSLTEDTRIGLFVVAQLAARHDVRITLRESVYGGIRAIVLIPTKELATGPGEPEAPEPPRPAQKPSPEPREDAVEAAEDRRVRSFTSPAAPMPTANGQDTVTITVSPKLLGNGNGGNHSDNHTGNGTSNGSAGNGKPPLPRRRRQANIAPQLRDDDGQPDEPQEPSEASSEPQPEPTPTRTPESFQATMQDFQRGTRRARSETRENSGADRQPRWPGVDTT